MPPKLPKSRISGNSFGADLEPALETSPTQSEKPDLPSTSNASLTPPPPGSEDVLLDDEEEEINGDDEEGTESGDKEAVKPKIELEEATEAEVKEEELARNSERSGSHSRAKRRRGEEALLLDDHLLPPEIRHISQQSTSRRSSNAKGDMEDEKRGRKIPLENMNFNAKTVESDGEGARKKKATRETVVMDDSAVEGEEEIADAEIEDEEGEGDEFDDEEGQDITRCVCQTDGELVIATLS